MRFIPEFEDLFLGVDGLGNSHWMNCELLLYKNYLQYLGDARSIISTSVQACQVWSAPYDGLRPSPQDYQKEEEEQEDGGRDEEDVCPSLTTPRLQPPTSHHSSLTRTPELEWDDSYDADPDEEENQTFHFVDNPQPPQHIQEMRKSAILLIRGSYVEESEFQDDVLVYNLIAQKDAREDRIASFKNSPRRQNDKTTRTETSDNPHLHSNSITPSDSLEKGQNQESEGASPVINGHIDEKKTEQSKDKSAHVLEEQYQDASDVSSVHLAGEDFVSQFLQLIDWDKQSILEDHAYFQKLTALLYGEETETDFNLICSDDKDDERKEGTEQRDGDYKKSDSFTGEFFFLSLSYNQTKSLPKPNSQCTDFHAFLQARSSACSSLAWRTCWRIPWR